MFFFFIRENFSCKYSTVWHKYKMYFFLETSKYDHRYLRKCGFVPPLAWTLSNQLPPGHFLWFFLSALSDHHCIESDSAAAIYGKNYHRSCILGIFSFICKRKQKIFLIVLINYVTEVTYSRNYYKFKAGPGTSRQNSEEQNCPVK